MRAGDEVALVPPVSGGAGVVRTLRVTAEPLDLAPSPPPCATRPRVRSSLFEGVTREVPELDYEAYVDMAEQRLRAIGEEVAAAYGLTAVALQHRTGTVPLGEPSVIVAASAPHRGEAFNGARALIDRVKAEAPIWKVEVDAAGCGPGSREPSRRASWRRVTAGRAPAGCGEPRERPAARAEQQEPVGREAVAAGAEEGAVEVRRRGAVVLAADRGGDHLEEAQL